MYIPVQPRAVRITFVDNMLTISATIAKSDKSQNIKKLLNNKRAFVNPSVVTHKV